MHDEPPTAPIPAGTGRWLALAALAAVVGGGLYLALDRQPTPAPEPPVAASAPEPLPPRVQSSPMADVAATLGPAPAPLALAEAPRFDVVRVAPDGGAVVAGRAAPGATVTIYADAAPLAAVEADAAGNFVAIFRAEPSEAPLALTLGAAPPGGVEVVSEELVVLLPEAPEATAAPALPGALADAGPEPAPPPDIAIAAAAPESASAPAVAIVPTEPHADDPEPSPPVAGSVDPAPEASDAETAVADARDPTPEPAAAEPEPEPAVIALTAPPPADPAEQPAAEGLAAAAPAGEIVEVVDEPLAEASTLPATAEPTPDTIAEKEADRVAEIAAIAPAAVAEEPEAAPQAAAPAETAARDAEGPRPRVAATAILRADGVEVVAAAPQSARQVSLASISYADGGEVTLAGLGTAGARLRAYVDDGFAQEGVVGQDGRWSLALGDVEVGVYRLRIDQMDGAGQVASRIETPFQRDLPRAPLPRPPGSAEPGERPTQVTVQPGANLWTLARVHYGAGVLYTQIFVANQHLIRDPHLIYPGQIFDLPGIDDDG